MERNTYKPGRPVKFNLEKDGNTNTIYGRVMCLYRKDNDYISFITPHGSIFRIYKNNLSIISDSNDLQRLKELERDVVSLNYHPYNSLLDQYIDIAEFYNEAI
jgi:hypothetical protein